MQFRILEEEQPAAEQKPRLRDATARFPSSVCSPSSRHNTSHPEEKGQNNNTGKLLYIYTKFNDNYSTVTSPSLQWSQDDQVVQDQRSCEFHPYSKLSPMSADKQFFDPEKSA